MPSPEQTGGRGGTQPKPPNAPSAPVQAVTQPGVNRQIVLANTVIVFGPTGAVVGVFVYEAGTTPGAGNPPIASMTNQTTDPYGNTVETGVAAYTTVSGHQVVVQLGLGSFAGFPAAGLFTHDQTSPATSDPFVGSLGNGTAAIYSGQSTPGATGAGVEAEDSAVSGILDGLLNIIAGQLQFNGGVLFDGTTLSAADFVCGTGAVGTANLTMSPAMAAPPNSAAVAAGTATLVQLCAFANGLYTSMRNRGMFN